MAPASTTVLAPTLYPVVTIELPPATAANIPLPYRTLLLLPFKFNVAIFPTVGTTGIAAYVPLPVNRLLTLPSKFNVAILPKLVAVILPTDILPVVEIVLEPNAFSNVTTLLLSYVVAPALHVPLPCNTLLALPS